ncbi:hypothetical protein F2Q68_00004157 [Brassica cretica]|uniref:RNase H type-1 domain-containing protein n=1 Tax=Brassica cretica TaxID=69181 RepID=A0A8S9J8E3_BRACR|nr:hypothetical protein F2Q68_00004157 [Brassica cretica]
MIPTRFHVTTNSSDNLVADINCLLLCAKQDKRELLNFFVGWKMRNNISFHHILKVIHAAIRENQNWNEAMDSENPQEQITGTEGNQTENVNEGWSLHSKEGIQKLRGSSSIKATNTPLEAEAMALLMAVRQIKTLRYENVAFISDCKRLIDESNQFFTEETITNMSTSCNSPFTLCLGPSLADVDVLAKEASKN